jgi:hypothetical protein
MAASQASAVTFAGVNPTGTDDGAIFSRANLRFSVPREFFAIFLFRVGCFRVRNNCATGDDEIQQAMFIARCEQVQVFDLVEFAEKFNASFLEIWTSIFDFRCSIFDV